MAATKSFELKNLFRTFKQQLNWELTGANIRQFHASQSRSVGSPKKKLLNRLSRRASFDSYINFYRS